MRDILIILYRTILLLVSALVLQDTWAEESPEAGAEVPPDPVALLHEGRYEEALTILEELELLWREEIARENTDQNRRGLFNNLWFRGIAKEGLQKFDEALDYYRQAHELIETTEFLPDDLANFLQMSGGVEAKAGLYDKAEKTYLQAIEQRKKIEPATREPGLSISQNTLGLLYLTTGRYQEAGQLFREAFAKSEALRTEETNYDALEFQHDCLGRYFYAMRSYAKAAQHWEDAKSYALSTGKIRTHPVIINLTQNIGLALLRLGPGSQDDARRYLQESTGFARELWELEKSPYNTLQFASHLSNFGQLELASGNNEKARTLFRESLDLAGEQLGSTPRFLAPYHTNLASSNRQLGNYKEALASYQRSMELYRTSVGTRHQAYIEVTNDYLETLLLSNTSREKVATETREFTSQALQLFDDIIAFGTERARLNWLRENQLLNLPCSLGTDPSFIAETILRTKARVIDSLLSEQQNSARDPELAQLRREREQKQRELDDLLFSNEDQARISTVNAELSALEARFHSSGATPTAVATTWQEVQESLPPRSAFVEYVRYSDLNNPGADNLSYGALLILPEGEPHWIPLGTDRELTTWLSVMKSRLNYRSYLLSTGKTTSPPALRMNAALRRLYDLFWAPVAARMPKGTETVGVSPDARLNFVSFAVLLDEKNRFLSEKYRQLVYYASARDLLVEQDLPSLRGGPWSLVAVPEFETHEGVSDAEKESTDVLSRVVMDTIEGLADIPGVRQELKLLRKIMPRHREGSFSMNSSEQELRRLSDSPVVLHLATHAFLLPPADQAASAELQDFNQAPDHFYRSGLVLTEAKKAHAARARGDRVPFDRDGVLFSNEVQNLPLQNTRLVTLSSCDSGMGESVRGDGVLGLRRGFTLAGSAAILLSLWPVSDDSTPAFMKHMYQLSLATDQIGQSLWETQRRNLSGIDPSDDAAMEEAILRYGCFVLCQRGPLPAAVEMPEIREPSRTRWALALAIAAVLVFFVTRKWRQEKKA